jgi:short-subunit dehydrogenase
MLEKGEPGHIVNTSSMAGLIPVPLKAPYTASKHALIGLTRTLEAEFAMIGAPIGVSVVCPGGVSTSIIDDEIARYTAAGPIGQTEQGILDHFKAVVDSGISPEQAGEMIATAIESNRFWVFPNAADYFGPVEEEWTRIQECRKAQ